MAEVTVSLYTSMPHFPGQHLPKPTSVVKRTTIEVNTGTTAPITAGTALIRIATDGDILLGLQGSTATATTSLELFPANWVETREVRTGDTFLVVFAT